MKIKYLIAANLQLFANPNTQTTGTSGLSDEMKTFYQKTLIRLAEPNLVHNQFGDKYPIPKNGGKTTEFRSFDSLPKATTPLTEGVTPDGQSLSVNVKTVTVKQYGNYVTLSDILQMTTIDPMVTNALKQLASQASRTIDTVVRDVLAGGSNVLRPNNRASRSALTASDTLKPVDIFRAAAILEGANAPHYDDGYVAIIHPYVAFDLMTSQEFQDITKYQSATKLYNGEIGKIGNVRFVQSTEAKIWNDSAADNTPSGLAVFSTLVMGSGAYATTELSGGGLQTIIKNLGEGEDPLNQRSTVGWKCTKATLRLVEQYMVRIETTSAFSSKAAAN